MNEKKMKDTDVICSLPELDDSDRELATCKESADWARNTTKFYSNGVVLPRNRGICLQVIDEETVRCIAVVSDDSCFHALSMMRQTFESVGIEFQIEPFAVIQKVTPRPEDAPPYLMEERTRALEGDLGEPNETITEIGVNNGIEVV